MLHIQQKASNRQPELPPETPIFNPTLSFSNKIMAELLKNMYSPELVAKLAAACARVDKKFDATAFTSDVFDQQWEQRELKDRMRHITHCLHKHLHGDYATQLASLYKASPGFSGFTAVLFSDFVEIFGLDTPDISIPALADFTLLCSSEFAIRPYLIRYPERMLDVCNRWAEHENEHIRRLASEGSRPRLPWGQDVPWIKKNPAVVVPILEKLKNDPSDYVRRSVANSLNDISKTHPQLVMEIATRWKGQSTATDKLLKHALRGLLKKGHADALALFGFQQVDYKLHHFSLSPQELRIGDKIGFALELEHSGQKAANFRLEYVIHYVKANGSHTPKVFQITERVLEAGEKVNIKRQQALADLTTRKHYPGEHLLAIHLNGRPIHTEKFVLLPATLVELG
jgi:3-methyladenine DNA glycosylase AlkC